MKLEIIKQKFFDLVGNEYQILTKDENINTHDKIKVLHTKCNHILDISPNKFISCGIRCKYCSGKNKKTPEEIKELIKKEVGNEYEIISPILKFDSPIKLKHISGEVIETTPKSFLVGFNRAKEDKANQEKRNKEFKDKIFKLVGDEYSVLSDYKGSREFITIRHNKCGNEYQIYPDSFIQGARCKKCAFQEHTKTTEQFKKEVDALTNGEYSFKGEYKSSKDYLEFVHKDHTFFMKPNDFQQGHRCPKCSYNGGNSKEEISLKEFIESLGFKTEKLRIEKIECDIYIPEKKIGFEYDGLYWHSISNKPDKNYHINKTNFFYKNGIRIVHIFSNEWKEKRKIVEDKIKSILGIQKNKIYARNCELKEINSKERNKFLNENHIQGCDRANISYGLFYNNELVAAMSFIKPRISLGQKTLQNGCYELSRYAGKLGYTIVGGFSKLFKNILKEHPEIKEIITYADLRWTAKENNVYNKNGFILSHMSAPSYSYTKNYLALENRFKYRKDKLKKLFPDLYDENKSETEIMKLAGFDRIYDCGNLVYKMKL